MEIKKLNIIISLGLVAIIGILIAQLMWTKQAYNLEDRKFNQKVNIALMEVVDKMTEGKSSFTENPVQIIANDYYVVNINNEFHPAVLEHYLKTEFTRFQINTDYVYALYNCHSDQMMYGKYMTSHQEEPSEKVIQFPKHKNLTYYFSIRFPDKTTYLISSLRFWYLLTFALIIILLVYVYSIYTIIQQKKFSELQRDFINNMTHEFKTPLSSILLASEALNKQEVVQKNPKLKTYTSIIINQSFKLNNHIEKILNIAKNDASGLSLKPQKIILKPFIEEIAETIKQKNENISIQIDIENDTSILADEFHFTNIVYNLLDNSIKYCETKPEILISSVKDSKGLYLKFKDNGMGIPAKNINHIFDKFYRVPDNNSDEINGFGLGLFYVKKIVQQHNWKISVENNADKGITITLFFPF
ncbi:MULTISPECIES: sensor histidine kinase [Chryseobacterium]|uniref:sensor histidine kinase n=1 Tax=Chryseobacterium TaxID=59732 RepID=UPI00195B5166|nr:MULTISPECIES: HAMP domain-containing sensor histidine kinase [Chryseobacterium]MBM7417643.1 two-component system phosphate regulon sensor histidine kinase PhoR [Chryseobacterium sp. JUb44]MDH6211836.1 two-component system phosphate regulon sensor histidine kinase PhoR [Chryseobacterium sp. BIGb0186]WSO10472.1 HAMP domain-containing sensor histidine kinase [Chryseobacterium scophthalmum]